MVVVNHNGGDLTLRCLHSVRATDWPAGQLELVLVENGSTDGVAARVAAELPEVTVLDAGGNRGFAGGCNLAMRQLDGVDHVALLNNDARVDPGWLRPLVDAVERDPAVGAANPKILFSTPFVDVRMASATRVRGRGDSRELGVRVSGARVDGREGLGQLQLVSGFWGLEHGNDGQGGYQWTSGPAHLRVPVGEGGGLPGCELRLSADEPRTITLTSGPNRVEHLVGPQPAWYAVPLGGQPVEVLNNVGSILLPDGHGADRGYLQADVGQFDEEEEIFAWCGAAVLLSRRYLESVGLFEDRFFLYYEDFDLSWRGRAQGWRYVYVPGSVVRHVHSASSVEGSRLFQHYDERNRLLMLTRNAPWPLAWREAGRHLLITGSYARRDILSPLAHRQPPSVEIVRRRLRAFGGFVRLLPPTLAGRRRLRARRLVSDRELLGWITAR